jgi:uncharacterized protein (TIGR03790 family)
MHLSPLIRIAALLSFACLVSFSAIAAPQPARLSPANLAVIVNEADPSSVEVGEYYLQARQIPAQNLIKVKLPTGKVQLSAWEFAGVRSNILTRLGPEIQAIVMVWTTPYAVECNSITSAMTLGYDAQQCKKTCDPGKPSPYFNSEVSLPYSTLGIRPSMLLPVESVEQAKALIDRGVFSSFRLLPSSAYLLTTSDQARNARVPMFPKPMQIAASQLTIQRIEADSIQDRKDVMFYFTGKISVPHLDTLTFRPGAIADHLTSSGGDLLGKSQMSSLRWLDAGATGSYGTVSEPCNYWQKFPAPSIVMKHYIQGETLIESYWKSVAWPAQGLFIGEPLASPYASTTTATTP